MEKKTSMYKCCDVGCKYYNESRILRHDNCFGIIYECGFKELECDKCGRKFKFNNSKIKCGEEGPLLCKGFH